MHDNHFSSYIALFENLSLERISQTDAFVSNKIEFKDPFNHIVGIESFKLLLKKTLSDVENPTFKVTHKTCVQDTAFLKWHFTGVVSGIGHWEIIGMTELSFDADGRVSKHIDYWDASEHFYMKLPIIGWVLRKIKRRLQVD